MIPTTDNGKTLKQAGDKKAQVKLIREEQIIKQAGKPETGSEQEHRAGRHTDRK